MLMNTRAIAAIALSTLVLPAVAQVPESFDATLDISGATASDGAIKNRFFLKESLGGVCQDGTLTFLEGSNDDIYTLICNINGTAGAALFPQLNAGDLVRVSKIGDGGSSRGCGPVADAATLPGIPVANAQGANLCDSPVPVPDDGTNAARVDYLNCPATEQRVTEAGFSDIECGKLGATPAQQQALNATAGFQVIFGFPVSRNIFRGLQECQGLPLTDLAEDAPSLPKSVVTSLYTGQIILWDQINCDPNDDGVVDFTLSQAVANAGETLASPFVSVQRRVETSGTQTFSEIWAVRENCTTGISTFLTDATGACTTGGRDCAAALASGDTSTCCNSGSGDVRSAIAACTANGIGCVGVLSTDSSDTLLSNSTGGFVKIDGFYPSLCNVADGLYTFSSLNTAQFRSGDTNPLFPVVTGINTGADVQTANASECAVTGPITGVCTGFMADGAAGGPQLGTVCSEGTGGANDPLINPKSRFTRAPGGTPNNCQPMVLRATAPSDNITLRPAPQGGAFRPMLRRR